MMDRNILQELPPVEEEVKRPESDDDLAQLLSQEYTLAQEASLKGVRSRTEGLAYYLSNRDNPNGMRVNDAATLSRMVSKDVAETTDNLLPDLERTILSNERLVEFEAQSLSEMAWIEHATLLVNQAFRAQSDLDEQILDFTKDGLLLRAGVGEIVMLAPQHYPETVKGVSYATLFQYSNRPDIVGIEEVQQDDNGTFTLKLVKTTPWKLRVQAISPSALYVCDDADNIDQSTSDGARYVCISQTMSVASAIQQWPEKAELWKRAATMSGEEQASMGFEQEERLAQLADFASWRGESVNESLKAHNLLASNITVLREYYRVDLDKDDFPELWSIIRCNNVIIHREPVQDNPFFMWTPYRIPHEMWGESHADKVIDLQDLKTSFFRSLNDSTAFRSRPRIAFNYSEQSSQDVPTMADIVNWRTGGPIRTLGPPRDMLQQVEVPDVGQSIMGSLEYADRQKDLWTGVTRSQMALDPEAVSQESAKHLDRQMSANNGRKEFLARRLAKGFQTMATKALQALIRHGQLQEVKQDGQWIQVDPSAWFGNPRPIVHISAAVGSRDIEIMNIERLLNWSFQFLGAAGPNNPYLGFQEIGNALRELCDAFGFKDYERFIQRPDDQKAQQFLDNLIKQQVDPQIEKSKMEAETKKLELQSAGQIDKYRLDQTASTERLKIVSSAKMKAAELKSKERVATKDRKLDRWKVEQEIGVKRAEIKADKETAKMQADAAKAKSAESGGGNS